MFKKSLTMAMLSGFVLFALIFGVNLATAKAAEDVNFGPGGRNGGGMLGNEILHDYVSKAFAESLGMSVDDLNARLSAGATMYTIAIEKGWTADQFSTKMSEVFNKAIDSALSDGKIDQQQADFLRSRMGGGLARGGQSGGAQGMSGQMMGRGMNGSANGGVPGTCANGNCPVGGNGSTATPSN